MIESIPPGFAWQRKPDIAVRLEVNEPTAQIISWARMKYSNIAGARDGQNRHTSTGDQRDKELH